MWTNEIPPFFYTPEPQTLDYSEPEYAEDPDIAYYQQQLYGKLIGNIQTLDTNLSTYVEWFAQMAEAFLRYNERNTSIINGQVEFPTQYAIEHSGNLKVSYSTIYYDPSWDGASANPWIAIPHNYGDGGFGQRPRGWFQMANSEANSSGRFLDQLVSSSYPWAFVQAPATGTWTNATIFTADDANSWVNNFITAGDEIKWSAKVQYIAGAPYVDVSINPNLVVAGTGAVVFPSDMRVGQFFLFDGFGYDQCCRRIVEIIDSTHIIVAPGYLVDQNNPAGPAVTPYSVCYSDTRWRRILSVTADTPDFITVESPGTDCPIGVSGKYVIRRPPDETYIYVHFAGSGITETTFCCY
jgi:hypothetical protein